MELDIVLVVIFVCICAYFWWRRELHLPPGPIGLPILGYLPFLGKRSYVELHRLTLKYGPVFSFYLGRQLVIVLGTLKVAKEALTKNELLGRPPHPPNDLLPDSQSFATMSGALWKEQRQYSIQLLRRLGMGKMRLHYIIQEEVGHLLERLTSLNGKAFNLNAILIKSVNNNILTLLAGHRVDYDDEVSNMLSEVNYMITRFFRPTIAHAFFPWLRRWLAKANIWDYKQLERVMDTFGKFADTQIDEKMNNENINTEESYLDGFIATMRSKANDSYSKEILRGNYLSLLGAGSTPSRATLEWALVCMINFPDVQRKIHLELDSVLGRKQRPTWNDRINLPYTVAVIMEVMRSNTTVPISMLRCASKNTQIGNYDVPKGAIIMTNLWGIHHHPDDWSDPDRFHPERFLVDGKIVKSPALIPFSYGKRNCPGEDMANELVFVYFASILQEFSISLPAGLSGKFREEAGIAHIIVPDNVCFILR